jgi:hypothetical protein
VTQEEQLKAIVDFAMKVSCEGRELTLRELMLGTVGRIALSVGVPMRGMQREMIFVKSGLALGLISPVNDPIRRVEEGAILTPGGEHGAGTSADSDWATAQLR